MTDGSEGPRLVPYKIQEVLKLRHRLVSSKELQQFVGPPLKGKAFARFIDALQEALPGTIAKGVLRDSVQHLAGVSITPELLASEAWRLAGNMPSLRHGKPAPLWQRQRRDEWVPVQAVDMRWWRDRHNKLGATVTCRILAGSPAGLLTSKFFSSRFWQFFGRQLGFASRRLTADGRLKGFPLQDLSEIVGMRFYALLIKEISLGKPKFTRLATWPSLKTYNRNLIRQRHRVKFKCPQGYQHACWKCHVGYDHCLVAVHPRTYVRAECKICKNKKAWLDPQGIELQICVDCRRERDIRRRSE